MTRKLRVKDSGGERELLLVGTMRVGRDPRCEITSADPALSRQHAEFIESGGRTVVRDLESRHGIQVNGVTVTEATLQAGDIVQVAGVTITYIAERDTAARAESGPATEDQTVVIRRTPAAAAPAPPPRPPTNDPPSDATVVVKAMPTPPLDLDTFRREPAATPRAASAAPAAPRDTPRPPAPKARPAPKPAAPSPPAADAGELPLGRAPLVATPRKSPRLSWTTTLWMTLLVMTLVVFVATVVPFRIYQQTVVDATATARAQALARWLAADAAAAMAGAGDVTASADEVGAQSGVVVALVLAPDGSVLAPGSRSTERVPTIPDVGATSEVYGVRVVARGDLLEAVAPVRARGENRAAVAWVSFRPSAGTTVSQAVAIGPAIVLALVAWIVAARLLQRRTLRAVTYFGEDIELAAAGQIDEVGDTLGVKPMQEVVRAVNYLLARVRSGSASAAASAGAPRPAPGAARAAARVVPSTRQEPVVEAMSNDCTIVANEKFRITEATEGTLELLGIAPAALKGQHLLDAIPDRTIGDAVLKLLTDVTQGGVGSLIVQPAGQTFALAVHVSRSGPSAPITARFVREER